MESKKSVLIFNKAPTKNIIKKEDVNNWVKKSIKKAKNKNISGKKLTPFLISEINKESNNRTLKTNISLIINNAELAGRLSKEYFLI